MYLKTEKKRKEKTFLNKDYDNNNHVFVFFSFLNCLEHTKSLQFTVPMANAVNYDALWNTKWLTEKLNLCKIMLLQNRQCCELKAHFPSD